MQKMTRMRSDDLQLFSEIDRVQFIHSWSAICSAMEFAFRISSKYSKILMIHTILVCVVGPRPRVLDLGPAAGRYGLRAPPSLQLHESPLGGHLHSYTGSYRTLRKKIPTEQ